VNGILRRVVQKAGYQVVGTIVTHYHFDHVGGKPPAPYDRYHVNVDGLVVLLRRLSSIPVYIHPSDVAGVVESNPALPMDRVIRTDDGFELAVGQSVHIRFIHTPGHTPGSQCLLVNGCRLFSGDTLFISSIGRLDFPDSDSREMFNSMRKLRELDGDIMILPGK
jgi:glyoxylase-like metal-dependent hydrolase (beta-lactamase superfamily II)